MKPAADCPRPDNPAYDLIPNHTPIPGLRAQENADDPTVFVKLFTPASSWTWLLTEYDPAEQLAFGFCYDASYPEGAELGYVSLLELKAIVQPGLPAVERDLQFRSQPLSRARKAECQCS